MQLLRHPQKLIRSVAFDPRPSHPVLCLSFQGFLLGSQDCPHLPRGGGFLSSISLFFPLHLPRLLPLLREAPSLPWPGWVVT